MPLQSDLFPLYTSLHFVTVLGWAKNRSYFVEWRKQSSRLSSPWNRSPSWRTTLPPGRPILSWWLCRSEAMGSHRCLAGCCQDSGLPVCSVNSENWVRPIGTIFRSSKWWSGQCMLWKILKQEIFHLHWKLQYMYSSSECWQKVVDLLIPKWVTKTDVKHFWGV